VRDRLPGQTLVAAAALAAAALAAASPGPAKTSAKKTARPGARERSTAKMEPAACVKTVAPADAPSLQSIVDALPAGALLCLGAGRYPTQLTIARPLAIRGPSEFAGDAILDGGGAGTVLRIWADGGEVRLSALTITNGAAQPSSNAGALYAHGSARVVVENVAIRGNACDLARAQAVLSDAAEVVLRRCRVDGNTGRTGGRAAADRIGALALEDTLVEGNQGRRAISARGGSRVTIARSTVAAGDGGIALDLAGNPTQRPRADVADAILVGGAASIQVAPDGGTAGIARSVLSGPGVGVTAGDGNRVAPAQFAPDASFAPGPGSPARGLARNAAGTVDVLGRPRASHGCAGAIEADADAAPGAP
jgi:hypothetical protein